jgi:hypothetical protein
MTSIMMIIFSTATEHLGWFLIFSGIVLALMILTGVTSMGEIFEMPGKMVEYCPACM